MRSQRTTTKSSPRSPQLEKAHSQQQRSNTAKNKINLKKENMCVSEDNIKKEKRQLRVVKNVFKLYIWWDFYQEYVNNIQQ